MLAIPRVIAQRKPQPIKESPSTNKSILCPFVIALDSFIHSKAGFPLFSANIYVDIEYEKLLIIPGITNSKDQRKVNNPTRNVTLNADQKSSKPEKESSALG